jgi:hypothetical protein
MSRESRQVLKKIFDIIPGPYWGFLSMIASLLGVIIAASMFPGYSVDCMISYLGYIGYSPGALFFNLGMILSGSFAIVFYLYFTPILKSKDVMEGIHRTALVFAMMSCIFYILIGVLPSGADSYMILAHGVVSMLCLMCGILYKSLFGYMMLKSEKFLKIHTYSAMIVVAIEITFLLTWIAFIEWIMVFAIIYWIFMLTFHVFSRKELRHYL